MRIIFALLAVIVLESGTTGAAMSIGVVLSDKMYTAAKHNREHWARRQVSKKSSTSATTSKSRSAPAAVAPQRIDGEPDQHYNSTSKQGEERDKTEPQAAK